MAKAIDLGGISETLNDKADLDFNNCEIPPLTENQITNCLLENPKLVNVELNNGVLTLKAGSTVIVPYGTQEPVLKLGDPLNGGVVVDISWDNAKLFYYVRYDNNKTIPAYDSFTRFCNINQNGNADSMADIDVFSGDTAPTSTTTRTYAFWYDTTNNIVKYTSNDGATWVNYYSLPFALAKSTDAEWTSIDQVFNSIGYIGSAVWVGKGVKGLIPNGFNTDGTLKNIECLYRNVKILNSGYASTSSYASIIDGANGVGVSAYYLEQETVPTTSATQWYKASENKMYRVSNTGVNVLWGGIWVARFICDSVENNRKISSFEVKPVYKAVDNFDLQEFKKETADNIDTKLNQNQITNCVLSVPQNINFTLSDGKLTLKAGSKVYIPNGLNIYKTIITTSDISINPSTYSNSSNRVIVYQNNTLSIIDTIQDYIFSSETAPTSFDGSGKAWWWDTTNNIIKRTDNSGASWIVQTDCSLPLGLCSITTGTGITNISQTFNGFGYLGNTIFILPGVKGLAPNGRNSDGSLNNILYEQKVVATRIPNNITGYILLNGGTSYGIQTLAKYYYDNENNYNYSDGVRFTNAVPTYGFSRNGNNITLYPKLPFHALDRNETNFMAHQAMPSNKYIDLTVGNSGTQYTAPADGYFYIKTSSKNSSSTFCLLDILNSNSDYLYALRLSDVSSEDMEGIIPCQKGYKLRLIYDIALSSQYFRFIYAQGAI